MVIIALTALALNMESRATEPTFCERQMTRFDGIEKSMAFSWDYGIKSYNILNDLAAATKQRNDQASARQSYQKIFDDRKRLKSEADVVIALMLASDCTPPDHEATHTTYSKVILPAGPTY